MPTKATSIPRYLELGDSKGRCSRRGVEELMLGSILAEIYSSLKLELACE